MMSSQLNTIFDCVKKNEIILEDGFARKLSQRQFLKHSFFFVFFEFLLDASLKFFHK